jgi:hypothetical protein
MDQREVTLLDFTLLKSTAQARMGPIVLGDDQETGSPLVDAVDNSGPALTTSLGKVLKPEHKAVSQCRGAGPSAGMDNKTRGFFDNRQIVVFMDDLERHFPRFEFRTMG